MHSIEKQESYFGLPFGIVDSRATLQFSLSCPCGAQLALVEFEARDGSRRLLRTLVTYKRPNKLLCAPYIRKVQGAGKLVFTLVGRNGEQLEPLHSNPVFVKQDCCDDAEALTTLLLNYVVSRSIFLPQKCQMTKISKHWQAEEVTFAGCVLPVLGRLHRAILRPVGCAGGVRVSDSDATTWRQVAEGSLEPTDAALNSEQLIHLFRSFFTTIESLKG